MQDDLAALQGKFDQAIEEHQKKIKALENSIEECTNKHHKEVSHFQKLLKEREVSDRERESEREKEHQADLTSAKESLEAQLEALQAELKTVQERNSLENIELQENHQKELTLAQQEVENLKEELAQKGLQHEEDMRALEEDYEIERERLLLLQEELTEQLALKGTKPDFYKRLEYEQDVL